MNKILVFTQKKLGNLITIAVMSFLEKEIKNFELVATELGSVANNSITMQTSQCPAILICTNLTNAIETINMLNEGLNKENPLIIINIEHLNTQSLTQITYKDNIRICSIWAQAGELTDLITLKYEKLKLCTHNSAWIVEHLLNAENSAMKKEFNITEREILKCAKAGMSIKETANKMKLSANTIATYRTKIVKKSGFSSLRQLCSSEVV